MFDRLLILNKGKIAYFDHRRNLETYYEKLEKIPEENINPLDYVIDVAQNGGDEVD